MPKGLREYLHKTETAMFIQGRVPKPLGERVKAQLEKEGISWPNFLKASCERFLAETEGKSSGGIKSKLKGSR